MGADMIDWDVATSVATRLAGEGPRVTAQEAAQAVGELRADAARSTGLVEEVTGLVAPRDTAPVYVVDREGWINANAQSFTKILDPLADKLITGDPGVLSKAIGSRVTGTEVGLMLGFMGSKVLGQFDPFSPPAGRLLLVAPNVVHVERELDADPTDFRLWVCLHEETHRVQFTAVPWMRDHLFDLMHQMIDTVEPTSVFDGGIQRISEAVRGEGGSIMELFASPQQRQLIDQVTGVMSLLEGHADVVMDDVGPSVIPSVARIRRRFTDRRKGIGPLDRILRRLLGLDAKMAQYRDGARFVRGVVDKVGMEQFNAVWAEPANLPDKADLADPDAWISRVLT